MSGTAASSDPVAKKLRGIPDWMGVTGLGVLMLALVFCCIQCEAVLTRHSTGKAEGSDVVDDGSARTLVLVDRLGSSKNGYQRRVSRVDLASGAVTKRFFHRSGGCVSGGAGRIWCQFGFGAKDSTWMRTNNIPIEIGEAHDDGILLLDATTLDTVLVLDDAIDQTGVGTRVTARWRIQHGVAWYVLDDGHTVKLDPTTLKVAVADGAPWQITDADAVPASLHLDRELDSATSCDVEESSRGKKNPFAPSLLATSTLIDNGTGAALSLDGGDRMVLRAEKIIARDKFRKDVVSRVSADGTVRWSLVLGGRCERATRLKDLVVVSSTNMDQRAIGIDAATGAIRWKVGF